MIRYFVSIDLIWPRLQLWPTNPALYLLHELKDGKIITGAMSNMFEKSAVFEPKVHPTMPYVSEAREGAAGTRTRAALFLL